MKKWILFSCTLCSQSSHVQLSEGRIEIGIIEGAPGPVFHSYDQQQIRKFEVNENLIACEYNGREYEFESK